MTNNNNNNNNNNKTTMHRNERFDNTTGIDVEETYEGSERSSLVIMRDNIIMDMESGNDGGDSFSTILENKDTERTAQEDDDDNSDSDSDEEMAIPSSNLSYYDDLEDAVRVRVALQHSMTSRCRRKERRDDEPNDDDGHGSKIKSIWDEFEDEPEDTTFFSKWRRNCNIICYCTLLGLGGVVLAAVVIVVGVLFIINKSSSNSYPTMTTATETSNHPHNTGTVGTSWQRPSPDAYGPRYSEMIDKLSPLFPANHQDIPSSRAQQDALLWLAFEDPHPTVVLYELTPSQLLERFVLKLLHNTTEGQDWANPNHFLLASSVCEWGDGKLVQMQCHHSQTSLLETLHIDTQGLSLHGSIPTELALLSKLTSLTITNSQDLTGTIPIELGTLSRLTMLNLSHNRRLRGDIPISIAGLTKLEGLYLNDNALEGNIPFQLTQLPKLEQLWLQNNELVGTLPTELLELPSIETIRVEGNALHDCPVNDDTDIVKCVVQQDENR